MDKLSDDGDTHSVQLEEITPGPSSRFDFDDAFSDGEDGDTSFQLSSAAIRGELAKQHRQHENWHNAEPLDLDDPAQIEHVNGNNLSKAHEEVDTSVSTIDIGGRVLDIDSISPSQSSQPRSPDDSHFSSDFSRISLSSEGHDDDSQYGGEDKPYPNVIINAYPSPSHNRVEVAPAPPVIIEPNTDLSPPQLPTPPPPRPSSASMSPSASYRTEQPEPSSSPPKPASLPPSPSLSVQRSATPPGHRPMRSMGPSILEKVISKTRPSFLPPKSRKEDDKHMADWETMMKLSRAAEDKRRKALQERRLARERKIEDSVHIWEREVLPDWRAVYKKPELRRLWWGGIPTKLRATMWEHAVGNALALSKDNYRTCLARAKRALAAGTFPTATLTLIEDDVASTLPALHIFHQETGPLYQDLKDMLCAWVVSRSDEGLGYVSGAAKIAAMFLINMPPQQGFVVMRNLLERHCMRSFYGGTAAKDDVEAYYRIFDTLLADGMPKIYFNFKQHHISPSAYLPEWLLPLFLDHLPFEACARVWDVLLLEGDAFLYRAALAILAVLEPRLFFPDRQELLELLRGENKAALEVAKRDGRPLIGGKYEVYGVDEETLWERINSMDEWWKESTWRRLIQRELPDL